MKLPKNGPGLDPGDMRKDFVKSEKLNFKTYKIFNKSNSGQFNFKKYEQMKEVIPKKEIEKLFQENKDKFDAKKYEKGRQIIP